MKLNIETPEGKPPRELVEQVLLLVYQGAMLIPILDFSSETKGRKYPVKVFKNPFEAEYFAVTEGYESFKIVPLV